MTTKIRYFLLWMLTIGGMSVMYGQTPREIYNVTTNSRNLYCPRDTSGKLPVTFYWRGTPADAGNKFIAELSSPTGDFSSPIYLGELVSRGSQTQYMQILFDLPRNTAGRAYKIRIRSTAHPEVVGESAPFQAYHLGTATPLELNNFQSVEICEGSAGRTISITGGTTTASYIWYKDDQVIEGATGSSYTVTQPGRYSVGPDFGSCATNLRSNEIVASYPGGANAPAVKITGNATRELCTGQTLTLESEIENHPGTSVTFSYQWYKDGAPIAGANQSTYAVTQPGSYTVRANPSVGCEKTSSAVTVSQRNTEGLIEIAGGNNQVKCSGQTLVLTASLKSSLTGTYKWYKNNTEIAGANTLSYTTSDTGTFYITLTEAGGCVIKSNEVVVGNQSSVSPGDIKWLGHANEDVIFAFPYRRPVIELDIPSTETLTVRWFKEDNPATILQENTTRSFLVPSEGTFVAEVYDACQNRVSTGTLKLHVKEPSRYKPTIGFKQGSSPCGGGQAVLELTSLEATIVHNGTERSTLVPSADYGNYDLQWKRDGLAVGSGKEIITTRSATLAIYRLMVEGAFNSNEVKLIDIQYPTNISITTGTGRNELEDNRALDLIPTFAGNFQQELFTYKWLYRRDDSQPWVEKADVTSATDKKYTIPAAPYGSSAFREAVGQYQLVLKLKEATVNIGGEDIDLTPYAQSCGEATGSVTIDYTLSYQGKDVPNVVLLNGEDLNRKWVLPNEWAGAKVTIYKQTGEIIYQSARYNNDFPSFEINPNERGAAIYYFYVLEKDGKTQNGTLTVLH